MRALALAFLFAGAIGCTREHKPIVTAADEQIFALPAWCGLGGPKRPWTEWAAERASARTGNGVCGVRLPDGTAGDDEGVCVELRDHKVARAEVRDGATAEPIDAFTRDALTHAWAAVPARGDVVLVRLEGTTLRVRSPDGATTLDGPCFFR